MKVLGIDPSISEAAAALLIADGTTTGRLDRIWRIQPKAGPLDERLERLAGDIEDIIEKMDPRVIVVELPADQTRGKGGRGFQRRSVMTLPTYGAAVGAVVIAVKRWAPANTTHGDALRMFFPSVSAWTKRDVPPATWRDPKTGRSERDDRKRARVAFVEHLYKLKGGELGPESVAGNAADAVLLARWGMWREMA